MMNPHNDQFIAMKYLYYIALIPIVWIPIPSMTTPLTPPNPFRIRLFIKIRILTTIKPMMCLNFRMSMTLVRQCQMAANKAHKGIKCSSETTVNN